MNKYLLFSSSAEAVERSAECSDAGHAGRLSQGMTTFIICQHFSIEFLPIF
jgi:hypothetical protein